ncbi:hypothetical protein [Paraburkholderia aromaticivorans]|uniref:hypothetical protein n=1 Tax=Paraburkholderia aromaticivorans TaxID=2026199 RepID=UPI001455F2E7|nr:hypothetical protein [Paraburkholderia aromaticivorans]
MPERPTLEENGRRKFDAVAAPASSPLKGAAMSYDMHTSPIPDPNADPNRDPEADPLVPPSPGHHSEEPLRPDGPPDKDPV